MPNFSYISAYEAFSELSEGKVGLVLGKEIIAMGIVRKSLMEKYFCPLILSGRTLIRIFSGMKAHKN